MELIKEYLRTANSVFRYSLPLLPKTSAVEAVPEAALKIPRTEITSIRNKIQTKFYWYGSSTIATTIATHLNVLGMSKQLGHVDNMMKMVNAKVNTGGAINHLGAVGRNWSRESWS